MTDHQVLESVCKICPYKEESIFSNLSDRLLDELCQKKMVSHYKKDQRIFYEGEPSMGIFILCSGQVKLSRLSKLGKKQITGFRRPCGLLEEKDLFLNRRHTVTAEAMEDCVIGFVKEEDFKDFLRKNPSVGLKVIKELSKELEHAEEKIEALTEMDVKTRVATFILRLANEYGKETQEGCRIELFLTREEIAEVVGTTTESVIRVLSRFKKERIIKDSEKHILLVNKVLLQKIAGKKD